MYLYIYIYTSICSINMCLSPATCHLLPVTSHRSPVTCHLPLSLVYYLSVTRHLSFTCELPCDTCHLCHLPDITSHLGPVTCHLIDRRRKQFSGHVLPPWNRYIIIMAQIYLDARKKLRSGLHTRAAPNLPSELCQVKFSNKRYQQEATNVPLNNFKGSEGSFSSRYSTLTTQWNTLSSHCHHGLIELGKHCATHRT